MDYEVYRVLQPFTAIAGPALPWFGQPGLCLQLKAEKYSSAEEMLDEQSSPPGKKGKGILHKLSQIERKNLYAGKFGP